jgi:hypothetical protein
MPRRPATGGVLTRAGIEAQQDIKFFCFFFSKKEDSSFFEEKEAKRLLNLFAFSGLWFLAVYALQYRAGRRADT